MVAAEALKVQVMETSKRVLGDEHPNALASMKNLAFALKGWGLIDKAISLMEDCCKRQTAILGPRTPILYHLARLLQHGR
ncbi:hypothetical protein B0J11DRAFT_531064 [Dendryphion nanum]|uniref:Kinesin light chain n=1 Tax=Dendryphion nanum TaxID=256645 RepID=A0A9P9DNN0_9PLEO|nr:hypothetical protein B0J11DRAFT_531064 [Dendryphion nanum]